MNERNSFINAFDDAFRHKNRNTELKKENCCIGGVSSILSIIWYFVGRSSNLPRPRFNNLKVSRQRITSSFSVFAFRLTPYLLLVLLKWPLIALPSVLFMTILSSVILIVSFSIVGSHWGGGEVWVFKPSHCLFFYVFTKVGPCMVH